jgi:hypothetical protein
MLFEKAHAFKIVAFHKQIGGCINAFHLRKIIRNCSSRLVCEDYALHPIQFNLSSTFQEINQNNTITMMVSLQKQLNNQSIDREEQKLYTHALQYLTSRDGTLVKVEDWMIACFEVDYGVEIGAGSL